MRTTFLNSHFFGSFSLSADRLVEDFSLREFVVLFTLTQAGKIYIVSPQVTV